MMKTHRDRENQYETSCFLMQSLSPEEAVLMKGIEIASALNCQTEEDFYFSLCALSKLGVSINYLWIALIRSQM